MHPDHGYFEEARLDKHYDVRLLRRLLPFAYPYKRLILWSIFLVIGITALDLALPYVTKIAIDRYIVPQATDEAAAGSRNDKTRNRYLQVDLKNPAQREIVRKYSAWFEIEDQTARISLSDLTHLKKSDIKTLRRAPE